MAPGHHDAQDPRGRWSCRRHRGPGLSGDWSCRGSFVPVFSGIGNPGRRRNCIGTLLASALETELEFSAFEVLLLRTLLGRVTWLGRRSVMSDAQHPAAVVFKTPVRNVITAVIGLLAA